MTNAEGSERDPMDVGQPEEAELADEELGVGKPTQVEKPEDELKSGQAIEVKILRVDADERKIGLSLKRAQWAQEQEKREEERTKVREKKNLRGGLD